MNAVAEITRSKSNNIVALVEATPALVLTDRQKYSEFYEAMKAECDAHVPDLSTEKGRKAIASLAYKVARTKTAIDDAGKELNEEARARINAIDESRRVIRQQLDELKVEVRQPLTDWEVAEEARVGQVEQTIKLLRDSATVGFEETADDLRKRIVHVEGLEFDPDKFQGYHPQAVALQASTIATLNNVADRLDKEEADRAELARLREEAAERQRLEQERAEAEEAERRRAEAEKAEAERRAKAEAEQKAREEAAAKAAEERVRLEAESKAREEREATERAHAEELAVERRRAEVAERAEAEREAQADREAAAQAARDADRTHRSKILGAAKEAIMEAGPVDEATAKTIVLAIAAGNVPAISIRF
jgi:colicin import membrane protein